MSGAHESIYMTREEVLKRTGLTRKRLKKLLLESCFPKRGLVGRDGTWYWHAHEVELWMLSRSLIREARAGRRPTYHPRAPAAPQEAA